MRTNSKREKGSVLIVTILTCGILVLLMASYLSMLKVEQFSVARAQSWNTCIVLAEAGVEEAMAHLNNTNTIKLGLYPVNHWTRPSAGFYLKTNSFGTNGYYNTWIITTNPTKPVIISTGYLAGPLSSPTLERTVRVYAAPILYKLPVAAMVVSKTLDFKGSTISTDSFNSTNELYSTGGLYDPTKAQDHGDVYTLSKFNNDVNIGVGQIKGKLHTAPKAAGNVGISQNGSVGDSAWVDGGNNGIQSGHLLNDASQVFPDVTLPDTGGQIWQAAVPGNYVINGVTYKYMLNNNYPWYIDNLDGSVYVNGADVKLHVRNSVNFPSDGEIKIPIGKALSMYVSAPSAIIGGNGVINDTGVAKNFQYYGLPSNTTITLSANTGFTGMIYAPEADFTMNGGGNNTLDLSGLTFSKSVTMNGHFNYHFDEGALVNLKLFGYAATSWDEL